MEVFTIIPLLELKNLYFKANDKSILTDISLTIDSGDFITISGPSGSGKSTLLKLIANMIPISSGDILFNHQPINQYLPTDYRKEVSYFFQSPVLFGKTVRDNLVFPYDIRQLPFNEERALFLLKSVNLKSADLTRTIDSLSGGEKQRVAFVRNLLFLPKILLLDEVTSALDQENKDILHKIIKDLNEEQNITILWVTHNQDEFNLSSKHITLVNGELAGDSHE